MLSHDEDIKRVGDYTGTSVIMIGKPYGRFIRKDSNFGLRAMAQSENLSENFWKQWTKMKRFTGWLASPTGFEPVVIGVKGGRRLNLQVIEKQRAA